MVKQKPAKRRTQLKDLPKQEKELSKEEQRRVKGGETLAVIPSLKQDGSGTGK